MRALALDLSLAACGLAGTHDHRGVEGLWTRTEYTARTTPKGIDHKRIDRVLVAVATALKAKPDLVTVEWLPLYGDHGAESLRLAELHGVIVHGLLYQRHIPYVYVKPVHLKQYATGSGKATKTAVREQIIARYGRMVHVGDDNAADAMSLLALTLHAYGQPLAQVPPAHLPALQAVTWPVLDAPVPATWRRSA